MEGGGIGGGIGGSGHEENRLPNSDSVRYLLRIKYQDSGKSGNRGLDGLATEWLGRKRKVGPIGSKDSHLPLNRFELTRLVASRSLLTRISPFHAPSRWMPE